MASCDAAFCANCSRRTSATCEPGSIAQVTLGTLIGARVTVTSRLVVAPGSRTLTVTLDPDGPRSALASASKESAVTSFPSTARMRSPARSPAFCAGLPSNTETIAGPAVLMEISTPIPWYCPERSDESAAYCWGVRKSLCPVSPRACTRPRIAPYVSCVGFSADRST